MSSYLPEKVKKLADSPIYVTLATIRPDGSPRMTVLWIARDGDELLLSTIRGRAKERDIARDPRVGIMFLDQRDPYGYVEVRGRATLSEEGGRELIDALALKYTGDERYRWDAPEATRIVIRVTAERVFTTG
ncbi:PPOX class F420-dependent oxidoreductase [Protofrankia coriariae]|uniref:Pyridoxamine 5'-phosphate oxidase n=1 Tax=Protofrankia coriariae TaxID=1562887 RepID=A0ABR5F683_9ACTN|nr:PPOX class F420-dependent oxidoreductase [Protofrankia coriariae]KLL12235.1 pyridoxamine 5'-phosphate oxidase [Protofrankia coriariae]